MASEPHVCGCLFSAPGSRHLKPNTRGRSDAEKKSEVVEFVQLEVALCSVSSVVIVCLISHYSPGFSVAFVMFVHSDLGGTRVLLGPLGRGAAGPGKSIVVELKENTKGHGFTGNLEMVKLMQTGNLVERC